MCWMPFNITASNSKQASRRVELHVNFNVLSFTIVMCRAMQPISCKMLRSRGCFSRNPPGPQTHRATRSHSGHSTCNLYQPTPHARHSHSSSCLSSCSISFLSRRMTSQMTGTGHSPALSSVSRGLRCQLSHQECHDTRQLGNCRMLQRRLPGRGQQALQKEQASMLRTKTGASKYPVHQADLGLRRRLRESQMRLW